MRNLILVGAGGFSREVAWLAKEMGSFNLIGILDDSTPSGTLVSSIPVLGKIDSAGSYTEHDFVIAIGNPRTRKLISNRLTAAGVHSFATLIHPSVKRSDSVVIGPGAMICAGAILTVDINIGKHAIVNINATIGHDCKFGDFCTVAPLAAISGNVTLGNCVEVGTGASVRQGLTLESGAMLGMGSVLTKPIPTNQIFIGNPAIFFKSFN